MSFIEQLGEQAAGDVNNAINAGIGMLFEGHNDRRQIRQQQKLTDMQLAANKSMSDFNYGKQMDMWNNTNYEAQMEHIKNAGLNPALLYGGSGAGGTTTGSGSGGGGAVGGQAPSGGGEAMGMMMQAAQMELIKAQTRKTDVEADNAAGVDRANTAADTAVKTQTIENLKQNIKNAKAEESLTKLQTSLGEIDKTIKDATSMDQIKITDLTAQRYQSEVNILKNNEEISDATKNTTIEQVEQNLANTVTQGVLMKSNIQVNNAQIEKIAGELVKMRMDVAINQQNANTNYMNANTNVNSLAIEKAFKEAGVDIAQKALWINAGEKIINILQTFDGRGGGQIKGFRR